MIDICIEKKFKKLKFLYELKSNKNKVVLFGPSGAGKSNLLKMIAGFYSPDAGHIKINEKIFFDSANNINLPIFKRNVGYLPQEYTLFPNMTVKENIDYALKQKHLTLKSDIYMEILNILEIEDKLNENAENLSGGQKQRVAIARAIFSKPDILLFDEPFSALDKPIKDKLIDTLLKLIDNLNLLDFGKDIKSIFVTHSLEDAYILGDEIAIISNGKILEIGDKNNIFNYPKYLQTANLLNFKNIFNIDDILNGEISFKNINFSLKNNENYAYCAIRPENVMVIREDTDINNKENVIIGYVERIKIFGTYVEVNVKLINKKTVYVNLPIHAFEKLKVNEGKNINLSLKAESIVFLKDAK